MCNPYLDPYQSTSTVEERLRRKAERSVSELTTLIENKDERIEKYVMQRFIDIISEGSDNDISILGAAFTYFYLENSSIDAMQKIVSDEELIKHLHL